MELVSIIVPIYNVELYLERCIRSLVNQTYRNVEIILVNDGSPDNCAAICDIWAEKDSRIKVIHKQNGGLSDARNAGLAACTGDIIGFVDSDDWVDPRFVELLVRGLDQTQSDIAECCFVKTTGETSSENLSGEVIVCTDEEAMRLHMNVKMFKQVVWNKLYRRRVITVPFVVGKCHEDEFWTYQIIANCKKLVHIELPLYFYYQRPDSIMGEGDFIKRLDAYEAKYLRNTFVKERYPALKVMSDADIWNECIYLGQVLMQKTEPQSWKTGFAVLKKLCPASVDGIGKARKVTHKMWLLLAAVNLPICCRLRNHLGIGL